VTERFSSFNSRPPKKVWDGVAGRVVEGERITLSLVDLAPNVPVPEHHHENEQLGFVVQGEIEFTIGGETRTLHAGDTYVIPSELPHSVVTGPDGAVVVDVFAPLRADWAGLEEGEPSPSAWPDGG
jgi:quercetin dioxygenase-like cupin family protein